MLVNRCHKIEFRQHTNIYVFIIVELEEELAINWLQTLGKNEPSCHLYALWNRSAGDCLLDSVLQATWGVFDSKNTLRKAMSESLQKCSNM